MKPSTEISRLLEIMAALRTPETGCPWDLEQDFASIAPYTIEEAYEVADAIERGDWVDLCDELGDLLLQSVYQARIAEELGLFNFGDVVTSITTKMIRRHPHVFGDAKTRAAGPQPDFWDTIKAAELLDKQAKRKLSGTFSHDHFESMLDKVPGTLPAITTAMKLQKIVAKVGFDWSDSEPVIAKIREELAELEEAVAQNNPRDIADETGDLLFTVVNLARHLGIDPEAALRGTNKKVRNRFAYIERYLLENGKNIDESKIEELEALWQEAKGISTS